MLSFAQTFVAKLQEFLRRNTEERQQQRAKIPEDSLLWLALGPSWTLDLAMAAGFPAGPAGVERTFDEMVEQGVCTVTSQLGNPVVEPGGNISIPPSVRV